MKKLWMAVTPDKYELPLAVCDSAKELAELYNTTTGNVISSVYHKANGKRNGRKFVKVEVNDEMTGNEYQNLAARTINKKLSPTDMEFHALHGMVGEIGEIHSIYQKVYQGHKVEPVHLMKELGDLMWFVAEFCSANCWNLDDVMEMNIDKLKARYPEGFDTDHSLNRAEGDV